MERGPQPATGSHDKLREQQVAMSRKLALRGYWATPIAAPFVAMLLRRYAELNVLLSWCAITILSGIFAVVFISRVQPRLFPNKLWPFTVPALVSGVAWGILPWMADTPDPIGVMIIIVTVVSVGSVGCVINGSNRLGFQAITVAVLSLGCTYLAISPDPRLRDLSPYTALLYVLLVGVHGEVHSGMMTALLANLRSEGLVEELRRERHRIEATNDALTSANARLMHRTAHDPLTGLLNRVGLSEQLSALNDTARPGSGIAVVFIDLDGFKLINDSLGHAFGDLLLRSVAERCLGLGRHAAFARLGGDEFCAVYAGVPDMRVARAEAEQLRAVIDQPLVLEGREVTVTASLGVALGFGEIGIDELRQSSDVALYRAKERGRNKVAVFDEDMQVTVSRVANAGGELRAAFKDRKIKPWYQPEMHIKTRRMIGAESLARWIDGDTVRNASEFMPIAQQVGLEVPISDRLIRRVVRARGELHRQGFEPDFTFWVNVTPQQLSNRAHLEGFLKLMEHYETPGSGLGIEVTETDVIRDIGQATLALHTLRDHGVSIALDDFGTGHSSLSLLQHLPLDSVKVDRTFIRDIVTDQRDRSLVKTIISLAHDFGLTVTAEGVETTEQLQLLEDFGCDTAQGFLFSPAVPQDELIRQFELQDFSISS